MNYDFPTIRNISDFEPHLLPGTFRKVEKDGYVSFNYNGLNPDNFPPVVKPEDAMIREARGIAFDSVTGEIVARPFHKFFNMNERPETTGLDFTRPHTSYEKLDGSMIFPLYLEKGTRLATKAGITDTSLLAERFIAADRKYQDFLEHCYRVRMTPIFEYCSRENRIVIDYPEPKLVLLAVRDMISGRYIDANDISGRFDIPLVNVMFLSDTTPHEDVVSEVRGLEDGEGIVIVFEDGHRLKLKAELYVKLHKYVDITRSDRLLVNAMLSEQWDDIYSNASDELRVKLDFYVNKFKEMVFTYAGDTLFQMKSLPHYSSDEPRTREMRKDFALTLNAEDGWGLMKRCGFKSFDELTDEARWNTIRLQVLDALRSYSSKPSTWYLAKEVLTKEIIYGAVEEETE